MSIAWGIMALALARAEAPEGPEARTYFAVRLDGKSGVNLGLAPVEPEEISYEVRVVDTPAADWRDQFYRHCTRVGREGRSTIWMVDDKTAGSLMARQVRIPRANTIQAPKVTAFGGATATVDTRRTRSFVVDVDRVADGPVDHAPALAYRPSVEEVRDGLVFAIAGRRTASGVRAHVKLDSTWVGHVAKATTRESVGDKGRGETSLSTVLDLPQVVEAKVEGDYEVPIGHEMLVSLGTVTTADEHNRPVVMERLLLVAARPILSEAEEAMIPARPRDAAVKAVAAEVPSRMPPLPSRSPLRAVGPDGELPPLPDAQVEATSAELVGPPSPRPSPQAPASGTSSRVDIDLKPARLDLDPAPIGRSTLRLDGVQLASGRTQLIRIPLGGRLAIELKARLVPGDRPE